MFCDRSGLGKKGKTRVFYGLDPEYPSIAVVNLGKKGASFSELEELDEGRENVRKAVAGKVAFHSPDKGTKLLTVKNSQELNDTLDCTYELVNIFHDSNSEVSGM